MDIKNKFKRSYYSETRQKFLDEDDESILGKLLQNDPYSTLSTQKNAWRDQIQILKKELKNIQFDRILFEYTIPRMGRRIDNVIFFKGVAYLLEFKVGEKTYKHSDLKQVEAYALDLKYFQAGSRNCKLVPILICTEAPHQDMDFDINDNVCKPIEANSKNLHEKILNISEKF